MCAVATKLKHAASKSAESKATLEQNRTNELFFAVVGPGGAGSSRVASVLAKSIESKEINSKSYSATLIKASNCIREWAEEQGKPNIPVSGDKTLKSTIDMQDLGDEIRKESQDLAAVAKCFIKKIAEARAGLLNQSFTLGEAVRPDDAPRAFILDSIRHPDEVRLLRRVYGPTFALVGVVCEEDVRKERLLGKFFNDKERKKVENIKLVEDFMRRDAGENQAKHGQHVSDAFFEADYFIDNTQDDPSEDGAKITPHLGRLVDIIVHDRIVRPTQAETAMHHAYSARLRSACLSRQVGAALTDHAGNILATGTNEVPQPGGGVYGETRSPADAHDHRCAMQVSKFCSNNRYQNKIIEELIKAVPELDKHPQRSGLIGIIRETRIGQLLEFSRAVHAEMDALLSAGRIGASTVGSHLYVTTFPCHYCARHIVSAGVYEVQYIEPYPKSLARELHGDAIAFDPEDWMPPNPTSHRQEQNSFKEDRKRSRQESEYQAQVLAGKTPDPLPAVPEQAHPGKVLFRPFIGVAPQMYQRAFLKDRSYKDKLSGDYGISSPEWGGEWTQFKVAYFELEAGLTKPDQQ